MYATHDTYSGYQETGTIAGDAHKTHRRSVVSSTRKTKKFLNGLNHFIHFQLPHMPSNIPAKIKVAL
jgi:hypothetical protein